ncbi:MAG: metallophosphoesterase, partial [Anaerolineae bacterium]|nr:metallophosphoesterase [Anaerolineae bacterium]
ADSADSCRAAYQAYLGTSLVIPDVPPPPLSDVRRVVAVGDLHGAPSAGLLAAIINLQPDIVVVGGDLTNQQQVSPHAQTPSKQRQQLTLREELARVRAYLETILTQLPQTVILIMRGNHDDWAYRKVAELLPPYLLDFFQDPLDVLLAGLPESRVELVTSEWSAYTPAGSAEEFGQSQYMLILGDTLFSHANFTSGQEGGAVRKLHQWLYDKGWADYLGMPKLRVLCQFHGHKIAHLRPHGGLMHWIEPGMACDPAVEAYKAEYKTSWGPGAQGGLYLEQQYLSHANLWKTSKVQLFEPV